MCLAVLGKITEIKANQQALADYGGILLPIDLGLVQAAPGDVVLIHAGCAIAVLDEIELTRWQELMSDIESVMGESAPLKP